METQAIYNVSPSVLSDVLGCDTKGWLRHVQGFTSVGEAIKAVAGQAIHGGIAEYLKPEDGYQRMPLEVMHSIYDPAWSRIAAEHMEPSLTPGNLHRILARWMEMHPIGGSALPWKRVLSVEEAFVSREFRIPQAWGNQIVRLIVRPDAVVEDFDGRVRWLDTKTTGWRIADEGWRDSLKLSLQTRLYTDAVRQKYGDRAALGGWINAMEMRKLPDDPSRKCATHKMTYAECGDEHAKQDLIECMTTENLVDRAVADAYDGAELFVKLMAGRESTDAAKSIELETFIAALRMNGAAKDGCRFCPGRAWCLADRKPAAMSSFMHYEPWIVEVGTR